MQFSPHLAAMGIEQWVRRDQLLAEPVAESESSHSRESGSLDAAPVPTPHTTSPQEGNVVECTSSEFSPTGRKFSAEEWEQLQREVKNCTGCALHETRIQTVFGVGNPRADLLVIGEAPGAEEDRRGEPFVGRAGQLLDQMLKAIHLQRAEIFIANTLKCRPPQNRDPRAEEVSACRIFLNQQIAMIAPKLIVCVGRVAVQNLLHTQQSMAQLRRQTLWLERDEGEKIPVIATYHPAYLLRSPREKRKAWEDLKKIYQVLYGENQSA